jgi:hypothetical protein
MNEQNEKDFWDSAAAVPLIISAILFLVLWQMFEEKILRKKS